MFKSPPHPGWKPMGSSVSKPGESGAKRTNKKYARITNTAESPIDLHVPHKMEPSETTGNPIHLPTILKMVPSKQERAARNREPQQGKDLFGYVIIMVKEDKDIGGKIDRERGWRSRLHATHANTNTTMVKQAKWDPEIPATNLYAVSAQISFPSSDSDPVSDVDPNPGTGRASTNVLCRTQ